MTRSFASMLALLLGVVATAAATSGLAADLGLLARPLARGDRGRAVGRRLGATDWSRIVVLGGGPAFGIAAEWGLKLTETSQVAGERLRAARVPPRPDLGLRAGHAGRRAGGGAGVAEEVAVVEEARVSGRTTWLIARDEEEVRGRSGR